MKEKKIKDGITYVILGIVGVVMLFPVIWMFFACFKTNNEIFGSLSLLPQGWSPEAFIKGWKTTGTYTYARYFINTFALVVPTTLLTLVSCSIVAYGFARFRFPMKKILFMLMISTLMLPDAVIMIPRYVVFNKFGWIDTYLPFWVPAVLACYPFLIFMQIQFLRGIPRELDESAYMDGCNPFMVYVKILAPLMKPSIFSVVIFQTLWRWNDYVNNLVYISSVKNYTLSLALKMSIDSQGASTPWNQILAMSFISLIPPILLYFFAQKYFVEGITAGGIKG